MNRFVQRRLTWLDARAGELEARGEHRRARETREELCSQIREHLGRDHPWLAQNLLELAASYRTAGQTDAAEQTWRLAIRCLERDGSERDGAAPDGDAEADRRPRGDLAQALNDLGVLYCDQGRPDRASELFQRALAVSRQAVDENDPCLATLHSNLASALHSLEQFEPARRHYLRALENLDRLGPTQERAHCLCDLSELLTDLDDPGALSRAEEAVDLFRRLQASDPPALAQSLIRVAGLYSRLNEPGRAIDLLEEAADLLRARPGQRRRLAQCLDLLGHLRMALPPVATTGY